MKLYIKIDDTGGYPTGLIMHMLERIKCFKYQLSYFYDADIFRRMANR